MITFESRRRSPQEGYRVSWELFRLARRCRSSRKKRIAFDKQWQALSRGQIHTDAMKKLSIRNILVPIDFSKMSIEAIETAKRLGQRFGATIHLAHVHQLAYPADMSDRCFRGIHCRNHSKRIGAGNWLNSLKASRREPDFLRRNKRTSEQARLHFMKFANSHRKFLLI